MVYTLKQALKFAAEYKGDDDSERRMADRAAIDAIMERIDSHIPSFDTNDLTPGERLVVNVNLMLEAEVMNGGFHQFLSNSSGDRTEEIKRNLRDIGASETLQLLQRITSVFPKGKVPADCAMRNDLLDVADPDCELGEAETIAFQSEPDNLCGLLLTYVRAHSEDFAIPEDRIVTKLKTKSRIRDHYLREERRRIVSAHPVAARAVEKALRAYFCDSISVSVVAASVLKVATRARLDCRQLSMAVAMEVIGVSLAEKHTDARMLELWLEFERSGVE